MAVMTTVEVISHGMALLPNQRQIQGKDVYGNPKTVKEKKLFCTHNLLLFWAKKRTKKKRATKFIGFLIKGTHPLQSS